MFYILLIGNFLDYLTTFYYLNTYGFIWEKNECVYDNKSLIIIKNFGLYLTVTLIGIFYLIEEKFPNKLKKPMQVVNLVCFIIPTIILWKAVINNTWLILVNLL